MSVTATIPATSDYREAILSAGEADRIGEMLVVGDYLYGITNQASPGKIIRINKNDFPSRSTLTFPDDVAHVEVYDAVYVPSKNRIYILFPHASGFTITEVNHTVTPMTSTDVVVASPGSGFTHASMAADGSYLYVLYQPESVAILSRFALADFAQTDLTLTGYRNPTTVRASGNTVYAAGTRTAVSATTSWLLEIASFVVGQSATFTHGGTIASHGTDTLAISNDSIFMGYRDNTGRVQKVLRAGFTATTITTGVTSSSVSVTNTPSHIWVLFLNGEAVRIKTDTLERQRYDLNSAGSYITELVSDGDYLYVCTYSAPTRFMRYGIAPRPGELQWVNTVGGIPDRASFGLGVASDSQGNTIFSGRVSSFTFVNKYTPGGGVAWSKQLGGGSGACVDTDTADNIYLGGFDTTVLPGGGSQNPFLAKYSSAGTEQWYKIFKDPGDGSALAVAVAPDGNPVIAGNFISSILFGATAFTATNANQYDIFVAKISATDGTHIWVKAWGGLGANGTQDYGNSVAADSSGNIYLAGQYGGSIDFGDGAQSATGLGGFLLKLDSSGNTLWSRHYNPGVFGQALGVAVFANGDVVVIGVFRGSFDFGTGTKTSQGGRDIYLVKYLADGTPVWMNHFYGSAQIDDWGYAVHVDNNDNILIAGMASLDIDFGGGAVALGGNDAYIVKLDANGDFIWEHHFGAGSQDKAASITTDPSGNVLAAGSFYGDVDFGGQRKQTSSGDAFVLKLGA